MVTYSTVRLRFLFLASSYVFLLMLLVYVSFQEERPLRRDWGFILAWEAARKDYRSGSLPMTSSGGGHLTMVCNHRIVPKSGHRLLNPSLSARTSLLLANFPCLLLSSAPFGLAVQLIEVLHLRSASLLNARLGGRLNSANVFAHLVSLLHRPTTRKEDFSLRYSTSMLSLKTVLCLASLHGAFLPALVAAYQWPDPQYEALERMLFEGTDNNDKATSILTNSCARRVSNGSPVAAEWLRLVSSTLTLTLPLLELRLQCGTLTRYSSHITIVPRKISLMELED